MSHERELTDETRHKLASELDEIAPSKGTSDEIPEIPPVERVGGFAERWGLIGGTLLLAIVIGGIVALVVGSWWVLLIALGLHAVGTFGVLALGAGLLSESEHASPELADALREDGVGSPDRLLTDLADQRREQDTQSG